jgi:WD40 repeat protein
VHAATAGYDRAVRLFDITTGKLLKTFAGHTSSVATVVFNPYGNLIISGYEPSPSLHCNLQSIRSSSKDSTIKFWDVTSGLCVRTFSSYLGEVTSLQTNSNGSQLLSASKDNSNRLWDLKMVRATA